MKADLVERIDGAGAGEKEIFRTTARDASSKTGTFPEWRQLEQFAQVLDSVFSDPEKQKVQFPGLPNALLS